MMGDVETGLLPSPRSGDIPALWVSRYAAFWLLAIIGLLVLVSSLFLGSDISPLILSALASGTSAALYLVSVRIRPSLTFRITRISTPILLYTVVCFILWPLHFPLGFAVSFIFIPFSYRVFLCSAPSTFYYTILECAMIGLPSTTSFVVEASILFSILYSIILVQRHLTSTPFTVFMTIGLALQVVYTSIHVIVGRIMFTHYTHGESLSLWGITVSIFRSRPRVTLEVAALVLLPFSSLLRALSLLVGCPAEPPAENARRFWSSFRWGLALDARRSTRHASRWGLAYAGLYDSQDLFQASESISSRFTTASVDTLVEQDMTEVFCTLAAMGCACISVIILEVHRLSTRSAGDWHVYEYMYASMVGCYLCRMALAILEGAVAADYLSYACVRYGDPTADVSSIVPAWIVLHDPAAQPGLYERYVEHVRDGRARSRRLS